MKRLSLFTLLIIFFITISFAESKENKNFINSFSLKLFKQLYSKKSNVFISGYSIVNAFAITYNGAKGKTKKEYIDVFDFPQDLQETNKYLYDIKNYIKPEDNNYTLEVANALWLQRGFYTTKEFREKIKKYYQNEFYKIDFSNKPERALRKINNWTAKHTHNKIKKLLTKSDITPLTRLIITNAIYFKGLWKKAFKKQNTYKDKFFITKDKTRDVYFMYKREKIDYYEDNNIKAVKLAYKGNDIYMLIILPKKDKNLKDVISNLDIDKFNKINNNVSRFKVRLSLPKFKIKDSYRLKRDLQKLGLKSAFSPGKANFSGITGRKNLYIYKVIHKSFIKVEEKGTEAAASTAIVMNLKTASPYHKEEVKIFKANRPFIFFIVKDNIILFSGKVGLPRM